MKLVLIIIAALLELFTVTRFLSCWLFKEGFYYTPSNVLARVIQAINADSGMPAFWTKVFHNKVSYFGWGSMQTLLSYWDIRFLNDFLSILGGVGVYLAMWYIVTSDRRNKKMWSLIIAICFLAIVELVLQPQLPFLIKIVAFGIPFIILSLYGIGKFIENKSMRRYGILIALFFISLLTLILLPTSFYEYCLIK